MAVIDWIETVIENGRKPETISVKEILSRITERVDKSFDFAHKVFIAVHHYLTLRFYIVRHGKFSFLADEIIGKRFER